MLNQHKARVLIHLLSQHKNAEIALNEHYQELLECRPNLSTLRKKNLAQLPHTAHDHMHNGFYLFSIITNKVVTQRMY